MQQKILQASLCEEVKSSAAAASLRREGLRAQKHGDVTEHLHLPDVLRWLLGGLGLDRHALLLLQLLAA